MKDYIQIGIEKGLISINEDKSKITYTYQKYIYFRRVGPDKGGFWEIIS